MNLQSYTIQKQIVKFKLVFIGDQAVGKTSIINRFIYDTFQVTNQVLNKKLFKPTVGIDFISKCVKVENKTLRLQLWDTAGQERFRSLIPSYIRDSNVTVLCFDCQNEASFQGIVKWLDYVREERGNDVITVLVANKIDALTGRVVTKEMGEKFAQENDLLYFEVSAKDGTNIQNLFKQISTLLVGDSGADQESQLQIECKYNYLQTKEQKPQEKKINLKSTTQGKPDDQQKKCQC